MQLKILTTAVVVTGQAHNPTILHPAFLTSQKIVPGDWETADPPICTPPFARAKFKNKIVFTVDTERLQVKDEGSTANLESSQVPELARKYIRALPHVRYTGVGINITGAIETADPGLFLVERFVKAGPWNEGELSLKSVNLQLQYPAPEAVLRIIVGAATFKSSEDSTDKTGIIVEANYHVEVSEADSLSESELAITRFVDRHSHYSNTIKAIFGTEG